MTVSLRNTPAIVLSSGTLTPSATGNWNGTVPAGGDLLVAVIQCQALTTTVIGAAPAGWTLVFTETNSASTEARVAVYTRTAAGGDAAPAFTGTFTGTAADDNFSVLLYDWYDSTGGTPVLYSYGVAQGTSGTVAPVTALNAQNGCYGFGAVSAYGSSAVTWTTPSSGGTWVSQGTSAGALTHDSYANYTLAGPAAGSALTCSMAHSAGTTTFEAAFVALIAPPPPAPAPFRPRQAMNWPNILRFRPRPQPVSWAKLPPVPDWSQNHNSSSATLTWTHTVSQAPSQIGVMANIDAASDSGFTATCTCDGATMVSLAREETNTGGGNGFVQAWTLQSGTLTAGAHTIAITVTGGTPTCLIGGAVSQPGSVSCSAATVSNTDSAWSITVPSTATTGNVVTGMCATGSSLGAQTAGHGLFIENISTANATGSAGMGWAPSTGSNVTLSWASGGSSVACVAVELQQPGPITVLTNNLPEGYENYFYTASLAATGGTETGYTWSVSSGSLPAWATLNGSTGVITGNVPSGGSGSTTFTVEVTDSALNTATASLTLNVTTFSGLPYITGIFFDPVTGGYFHDQLNNPAFLMIDNAWALPFNAGAYNGLGNPTNWQTDLSAYMGYRQTQGYTATYVSALGNIDNGGVYRNGNTWDNVSPWTNGTDPSGGLNTSYWTRIDYLISQAAAAGLTVMLDIAYTANGTGNGTFDSGGALYNLTQAQYAAYGTALGNRYGATPNLIWVYGNDYYNSGPTADDTQFGYIRSAIIATGDQHYHVVHNHPESTERYDIETGTDAQLQSLFSFYDGAFNFVYSYNALYFGTERAYEEAAAHGISQLPVVWGDGYFFGTGASDFDAAQRQMVWWAIAAGARGITATSNNVWPWASTSLADSHTEHVYTIIAPTAKTIITAQQNWWKLLPDTSSTLVTAGRGTHASGITNGSNYVFGTDGYVVCSYVASAGVGIPLAVIYCAKAMSITVNASLMHSGYTATWYDPQSGAATPATPGTTYSSSGLGNNSEGFPDWVLILAAPPGPSAAALSGSGSLSATGVFGAQGAAALSGTGSLSATAVGSGGAAGAAALSGTGSLSATAVTGAVGAAALSGSGSFAASAVTGIRGAAALSGSGSLAVPSSVNFSQAAALSGTGSLSAPAVASFQQTAALSGSGTLAAPAVVSFQQTAALSGAGTLAAPAVASFGQAAALSGTGSLGATAAVSGAAGAALSGTGSLTAGASAGFQQGAALSGAGSLAGQPAVGYQGAAALSGAGTLAAAAAVSGTSAAALSGTGALSAAAVASFRQGAALTGTGTLAAVAVTGVTGAAALSGSGALAVTGITGIPAAAALSGAGSLTAGYLLAFRVAAALTGYGTLAAAGQGVAPVVVGAGSAGPYTSPGGTAGGTAMPGGSAGYTSAGGSA